MANRTLKDAKNIHGTNPQYLIEKIIRYFVKFCFASGFCLLNILYFRSRIYDSQFWKEQCFALTAELLVDKAMELRYLGGVYGGNIKPTPFICLVLKFLQIQPEKDIVVEFIKNEEFKYVRALGAFYLRLTGTSLDCYKYLEPLYNDNRKLRRQNRSGQYEIVHMDEFIDDLLREERVLDVILPRVQKRHILEENSELDPKVSVLDDDLEDEEMLSDDEPAVSKPEKPAKPVSKPEKREKLPDKYKSPDKKKDRGESIVLVKSGQISKRFFVNLQIQIDTVQDPPEIDLKEGARDQEIGKTDPESTMTRTEIGRTTETKAILAIPDAMTTKRTDILIVEGIKLY